MAKKNVNDGMIKPSVVFLKTWVCLSLFHNLTIYATIGKMLPEYLKDAIPYDLTILCCMEALKLQIGLPKVVFQIDKFSNTSERTLERKCCKGEVCSTRWGKIKVTSFIKKNVENLL